MRQKDILRELAFAIKKDFTYFAHVSQKITEKSDMLQIDVSDKFCMTLIFANERVRNILRNKSL